MKTVIVALNSKYIHSSLAPWYLKASCEEKVCTVRVLEFTINDIMENVLSAIYREKADLVAFSCYIWNISIILKLAEDLKKVSPKTKILFGGPEVSYDAKSLMTEYEYIDYIISGEGENSFSLLLKHLDGEIAAKDIDGLYIRNNDIILSNKGQSLIHDLDSIATPYTDEMIASIKGRIVYFESSRGCPFSCSYCISSTFEGVRYFKLERVFKDLTRLIEGGVKQIKFVDRTFNCNKERAKAIFIFIQGDTSETNFHFEAAADLFDEEMIEILSRFKPGKIQLEIGVQTTNTSSLEAVHRKTDISRVFENIRKLMNQGNIHIHLDLIAGLPHEDLSSFKNSFNELYKLKPHHLQLGFLKMLKGSKIRNESELYGYAFRSYSPYEILENRYISYDELVILKGIEELVERYHNSGRFVQFLDYLDRLNLIAPFDFYRIFLDFFIDKGYSNKSLSSRQLYTILLEFINVRLPNEFSPEVLNDLLKLDFLASDNSNNLPEGIHREYEKGFKEMCFEFLKDEENIKTFIPDFVGVPAKQIFKDVHFEQFKNGRLLLFNYSMRNKVTSLYEHKDITDGFLHTING